MKQTLTELRRKALVKEASRRRKCKCGSPNNFGFITENLPEKRVTGLVVECSECGEITLRAFVTGTTKFENVPVPESLKKGELNVGAKV